MQGWPGCLAKVEWLIHVQSLILHSLLFCCMLDLCSAFFHNLQMASRGQTQKSQDLCSGLPLCDYLLSLLLINLLLILVAKAFKCSGASDWAQVVLHVIVIIDLIHCNSTNLTSDLLCMVRSKVFDDDFGCCKGQKGIVFCKGKCRSQKGLHYFVQE